MAQRDGSLSGIKVARGYPSINHLLFADDAMFFCKSSASSVSALLAIIRAYEELSGQCINYDKSSITFSAKTTSEVKHGLKQRCLLKRREAWESILVSPNILGGKNEIVLPLSLTESDRRSSVRLLASSREHESKLSLSPFSQLYRPTLCRASSSLSHYASKSSPF